MHRHWIQYMGEKNIWILESGGVQGWVSRLRSCYHCCWDSKWKESISSSNASAPCSPTPQALRVARMKKRLSLIEPRDSKFAQSWRRHSKLHCSSLHLAPSAFSASHWIFFTQRFHVLWTAETWQKTAQKQFPCRQASLSSTTAQLSPSPPLVRRHWSRLQPK